MDEAEAAGPPPFALAVVAGGCASATVDVAIYPLDTLKTRLQAPAGFAVSGGWRRLFAGVLPTALSSVPGGAVFFGVYELTKARLEGVAVDEAIPPAFNGIGGGGGLWHKDACAAVTAAAASCLVRTPAAIVSQRMQIGQYGSLREALSGVFAGGGWRGFYTGLGVSIARELPFAFVQFPLYEALKRLVHRRRAAEAGTAAAPAAPAAAQITRRASGSHGSSPLRPALGGEEVRFRNADGKVARKETRVEGEPAAVITAVEGAAINSLAVSPRGPVPDLCRSCPRLVGAACGSLAGAAAAAFTTPLDVVRRRRRSAARDDGVLTRRSLTPPPGQDAPDARVRKDVAGRGARDAPTKPSPLATW